MLKKYKRKYEDDEEDKKSEYLGLKILAGGVATGLTTFGIIKLAKYFSKESSVAKLDEKQTLEVLDQVQQIAKEQSSTLKEAAGTGEKLTKAAINQEWSEILPLVIKIRLEINKAQIQNKDLNIKACESKKSAATVAYSKAKEDFDRHEKAWTGAVMYIQVWNYAAYFGELERLKKVKEDKDKQMKQVIKDEDKKIKGYKKDKDKLNKERKDIENAKTEIIKKAAETYKSQRNSGVKSEDAKTNILAVVKA